VAIPGGYDEVNGLYTITSVSPTGFDAITAPNSSLGPWSVSYNYSGTDYNLFQFTATVYSKQISLTAEISESLPYDITELGVYSLGSDQFSTTQNSRSIFNFTENENWTYFDASAGENVALTYEPELSLPFGSNPVFCSSNDSFWTSDYFRNLRQEKPRILDKAIIVPGNMSDWSSSGFFLTTSDYLEIDNPGIDLSNCLADDKIVLALSIANADTTGAIPNQYHVMLEFVPASGNGFAQIRFDYLGVATLSGNRYILLEKRVNDSGKVFQWKDPSSLKIYASIQTTGEVPTNKYAFVFDGLRLESSVSNNPLYALTAYTIVNNDTASKITKGANSKDLINFRLDLAIGQ
jgi:hypothetical protein